MTRQEQDCVIYRVCAPEALELGVAVVGDHAAVQRETGKDFNLGRDLCLVRQDLHLRDFVYAVESQDDFLRELAEPEIGKCHEVCKLMIQE